MNGKKLYQIISKENVEECLKDNSLILPKTSFNYYKKFITWLKLQKFRSLDTCLRKYMLDRFINKNKKIITEDICSIIVFFGLTAHSWQIEFVNDIVALLEDCRGDNYFFR